MTEAMLEALRVALGTYFGIHAIAFAIVTFRLIFTKTTR